KPRFYIIAEYPTANWVQNIRAHPAVQVRVAGQSFSAHARVICATDEPSLNHAVQELSRQKYGWGDGLVVELIPADDSSLSTAAGAAYAAQAAPFLSLASHRP